ncbi:MAG: C25 family cysteine peptidase, partial [Paludibacteraceae bacterium]|nr:C25 family cysteine peptidase [Paludibacteraceae bacterium]
MKKLFYSILLALGSFSMSLAQSSILATPDWGVKIEITPYQYIITFRPSEYEIVNDTLDDFIDVNHNGPFCHLQFTQDIYDHLENIGQAELPFYSLSLQLPDAADIALINSITPYLSDRNIIQLPYLYVPSQNRMESSYNNNVFFDSNYYSSNGATSTIASISSTYSYVGTAGVELTIHPFDYDPYNNKIIIPDSIKIVVDVHSDENLLDMINHYSAHECTNDATIFYDTYAGLEVENHNECLGEYIILTEDKYRNDLQSFVQHKNNLGYIVSMYDVETEHLSSADDIRQFLYNLYHKHNDKPRFLLLVGNLSKIPTSAGIENDDNNPPTDIYYACLEESSINDERNLYPELYVGRWLVKNNDELKAIMQKTIISENVFRYTTLCHASLFSGDGQGARKFNNNVKWISNKVLSTLNYPNAYYLGNNSGITSNTMQSIIAADTTWLFYFRGHGGININGSPYVLRVNDFYSNSYAYLGFSFACWMGNVYQNCFAKKWLCDTQKGGPLYFASTTMSYRDCNNHHSKRIFKMLKSDCNMHIAQMTVGGSNKYYGSLCTSVQRK